MQISVVANHGLAKDLIKTDGYMGSLGIYLDSPQNPTPAKSKSRLANQKVSHRHCETRKSYRLHPQL
jgi:hypothetical protein